ncbi:MAG: hypothetical protein QW358_05435 [Candidatus Hadarchaeum sp.]
MNITIRDLDEAVFRKFKAKAVEEGMKLGEAVTQAMETWIKQRKTEPRLRLLEIKPFDWGEGTERASIEVDQILYGGKR